MLKELFRFTKMDPKDVKEISLLDGEVIKCAFEKPNETLCFTDKRIIHMLDVIYLERPKTVKSISYEEVQMTEMESRMCAGSTLVLRLRGNVNKYLNPVFKFANRADMQEANDCIAGKGSVPVRSVKKSPDIGVANKAFSI